MTGRLTISIKLCSAPTQRGGERESEKEIKKRDVSIAAPGNLSKARLAQQEQPGSPGGDPLPGCRSDHSIDPTSPSCRQDARPRPPFPSCPQNFLPARPIAL